MFSIRFLVLGSTLVLASCLGGVSVDEIPPETTITSAPPAIDNHTTPSFEFSANEDHVTFHCTIDGVVMACSSPYAVALTDGAHTFTVHAVDAADNQDTSPAVHAWTIDTVAPDTTITQAPPTLDNGTSVSFSFSASEELATFECATDGGAFTPCASPTVVELAADGAHEFRVRATDPAGNVDASPAQHVWELDTSAPDTVIDAAPSGAVSSRSATITFSSPDAGTGASFECRLDGGVFAPCTSPQVLSNLAEGAHTFAVRVRDGAGSYDPSPATRAWTVDTIAPVVQFTAGPLENATSGPRVTFSFAANEAVTFTCATDQGIHQACAGTSAFNVRAGAHAFQVRATDAAGNTATIARHWNVICAPFPGGAGGRGLVHFEEVVHDQYSNPKGYRDSINNGVAGYMGASSAASGRFGMGIALTGSVGSINTWSMGQSSSGVLNAHDHTFSMWVRVTTPPSARSNLWHANSVAVVSYEAFDAGVRFVYEVLDGTGVYRRLNSPVVSLGEWHQVVVTFDANGAMTIWVDGVASTGVTVSAPQRDMYDHSVRGRAGTDLDEIYFATQAMPASVVLANYCPAR